MITHNINLGDDFVILRKDGIILNIEPIDFGTLTVKYHNGKIKSVERNAITKY